MKLDSFKLNYNINEFITLIGSTPNGDVLHQQGPFNLTSKRNTSPIASSQLLTVTEIRIPESSNSVIETYNFHIAATGDLLEYSFLTSPSLTSTHSKRGYVTKASGPLFGNLSSAEVMHKTLRTLGDIEVIFT